MSPGAAAVFRRGASKASAARCRRAPALLARATRNDHERLGLGMVVGEAEVDLRGHAGRGERSQPRRRAAGQRHGRLAAAQVDDAHVAPEDAALEARAERLGAGLLGREALGVARRARFLRAAPDACRSTSVNIRSTNRSPKRSSVFSMRRMSVRSEPMPTIKRRPVARGVHQRAHAPDGRVEAGEDRLADQEVADVELGDARGWRRSARRSRSQAVAGMALEPEGPRCAAAADASRSSSARCGLALGLAIGADVQLDHLRADGDGGIELARIGVDEERDADAGLLSGATSGAKVMCSPATSRPPSVVHLLARSGTRQAACGRWRSAIASISSVAAISKLSGSPISRLSALDVGVGDVAAILAQVGGDAVGAGGGGQLGGAHRIGIACRRGRSGWWPRGRCSRRGADGACRHVRCFLRLRQTGRRGEGESNNDEFESFRSEIGAISLRPSPSRPFGHLPRMTRVYGRIARVRPN